MSTKKIKISKNKKKQKSIRRTFVLFFLTFLSLLIRLQVVGAVVLILTVCTIIGANVFIDKNLPKKDNFGQKNIYI
jgi:dolichol kinase